MAITGTTVVRRQLGRRLQRLRERADITIKQVTDAHLGSHTKIWRIDQGRVDVAVPTVLALAAFYKADDRERDALVEMALGTGQQGWWQEWSDSIAEWFRLYVGLESEAATILAWDDSLIPGMFQTADYAEAIHRAASPDGEAAAIQRQVAARMARQERLFEKTPPPQMSVVLGEGALARLVGGEDVMAAQLARLRQLGERPEVDIRYLPFRLGAHAGMTGAFRILAFDDGDDPDVVYVEAQVGARYLEKHEELTRYRATFEMISKQSIPIGEYQCTRHHG